MNNKPMIISHRGNIFGPHPACENFPEYVDTALKEGYMAEIDMRIYRNELFLGHDYPQYKIDEDWLLDRYLNLWVHAKDLQSLLWLTEKTQETLFPIKYFYHSNDDCTIVNKNYIWVHNLTERSLLNERCIIPLIQRNQIETLPIYSNIGGVCTDYPVLVKK